MKIPCVVLQATEVQDDGWDLGHTDGVEQGAHLLLVEALDLVDALPEVDPVGGDLDLPHIVLLGLVDLHLLQAVPVHLLNDRLAGHDHDAPEIGTGSASHVPNGLPLQHISGRLVSLVDLVHETQDTVHQDGHCRLLAKERLEEVAEAPPIGKIHPFSKMVVTTDGILMPFGI